MERNPAQKLAFAAAVAALYAVLSYFSGIFGLAYGPIQCRISEALCVLPFLFPETIWGLFVGCLLSNLLSAYGALDIIFGSLATLIAAVWTSKVKSRWFAPLPPVICNAVIIGAVIAYFESGSADSFFPLWGYNALTVGLGEAVACYVLGMILLTALPKIKFFSDRMRLPSP